MERDLGQVCYIRYLTPTYSRHTNYGINTGFREATANVTGHEVHRNLKFESGKRVSVV